MLARDETTQEIETHCPSCGATRERRELTCPCGQSRPESGWRAAPRPGELLDETEGWIINHPLAAVGPVLAFRAIAAPPDDPSDPPRQGIAWVLTDPKLAENMVARTSRLRQLRHRAVARVVAAGRVRGMPYRVDAMPRAPSVRDSVAKAALAVEQVLDVGIALADALVEMHGHGLVSGWIDIDTVTLVLDRGRLEPTLIEVPPVRPGPDHVGVAPEVARGHEPDPRSDIWGVGKVLIHLLRSKSESEPAGPDRRVRHQALRELLDRMIDDDPDGRPLSALEVATRLRRIRDSGHDLPYASDARPALPPARVRRRRASGWRTAVALAGLLVIVVMGLWRSRPAEAPSDGRARDARSPAVAEVSLPPAATVVETPGRPEPEEARQVHRRPEPAAAPEATPSPPAAEGLTGTWTGEAAGCPVLCEQRFRDDGHLAGTLHTRAGNWSVEHPLRGTWSTQEDGSVVLSLDEAGAVRPTTYDGVVRDGVLLGRVTVDGKARGLFEVSQVIAASAVP